METPREASVLAVACVAVVRRRLVCVSVVRRRLSPSAPLGRVLWLLRLLLLLLLLLHLSFDLFVVPSFRLPSVVVCRLSLAVGRSSSVRADALCPRSLSAAVRPWAVGVNALRAVVVWCVVCRVGIGVQLGDCSNRRLNLPAIACDIVESAPSAFAFGCPFLGTGR